MQNSHENIIYLSIEYRDDRSNLLTSSGRIQLKKGKTYRKVVDIIENENCNVDTDIKMPVKTLPSGKHCRNSSCVG